MRKSLLVAVLSACIAANACADEASNGKHNHRPQVSSRQCGLSTPFNVLADSGGIWLYRDSGSPREIFFHGGELSVDQKVRAVSDADAQRLREMEIDTRALMPQVADIARAVVNITYDAFAGVIDIMTGSWLNARKIERKRKAALDYVDGTLGKGRWDQDVFDQNFEDRVQKEADGFKGSIARHMLWQMVTGRADKMDERADRIGDELDARLDAQSGAIEAKADTLCTQVEKLRRLQDALEFRYEGQPLQMLAPLEADQPGNTIDVPDDDDAKPKPDNGDKPHDDSIKVQPVHATPARK